MPAGGRAVKGSTSREAATRGSVALRLFEQRLGAGVCRSLFLGSTRGPRSVFWPVVRTCWLGRATLKDRVLAEVKDPELMDFAAENEETSGGGQSGAEGARLGLESDGERVRGTGGTEEAGGGEAGSALDGTGKIGEGAGGGRRAGMRVDLTVVKQEVVDWSETEQGVLNDPWAKQEVEDGPEVKEEKPGTLEVKQETDSNLMVKEEEEEEPEVKEEKVKVKEEVTDWLEVTEEKKDSLEIKREEVFLGQNIKTEERVDGMCVKEEKNVPKEEVMADAQVKEEPQMHPPVGSKRKLAMSR